MSNVTVKITTVRQVSQMNSIFIALQVTKTILDGEEIYQLEILVMTKANVLEV